MINFLRIFEDAGHANPVTRDNRTVCVCPQFFCSQFSLSRQRHDILDFSYCPLSRVLHVTLANWQGFGFQFHLRSSPS